MKRSVAAPAKAHIPVKNLGIKEGVLTGKVDIVPQPEAHPHTTPEEESSQGALLLGQPPEPLSLPCTPVTLEQQPMASLSREPHGSPVLCSRCSTLILQPSATLDSLLLQSQAATASDQALASASSEWQQKLEAVEALLSLRHSFQTPSDSISLHQPCDAPASVEEAGLQPPRRSPRPRPDSSISLPIGHLGCISLLH
ncbi:PREDICTED: doublesex- and mab-3-related transcription factor C1-like [Galeopterus variegatus]|uniref:Doublesex- and mab-3-related transcription factor C1-like n=1 Tax=Galeopterus variegatus TaxID=482537 RepID=A0ABM0SHD1_GALVR|nr:PREDICTED: doublesex- and mab-3-related transcription factor C1-like [Galeopterus variegatus]